MDRYRVLSDDAKFQQKFCGSFRVHDFQSFLFTVGLIIQQYAIEQKVLVSRWLIFADPIDLIIFLAHFRERHAPKIEISGSGGGEILQQFNLIQIFLT